MCFSASACFASTAVLVPTGAYCITVALRSDRGYLPLATFPLFFGIQQALEGMVWLRLEEGQPERVATYALGYTFFSHFLWLALVPVTAFVLNRQRRWRKTLSTFSVLGPLFGVSLFLPLVLNEDWLTVHTEGGSIVYLATLIYEGFIPRHTVRLVYALIIVTPLMLVPDSRVKVFGVLILISVVATRIFYDRAFISVWCFFAALLSLYIVYVLRATGRKAV